LDLKGNLFLDPGTDAAFIYPALGSIVRVSVYGVRVSVIVKKTNADIPGDEMRGQPRSRALP
jgi:hypothetical protein